MRDYECHWFSLDSEGGHGRLGALDDSVVQRITGVEEGKSKPSETYAGNLGLPLEQPSGCDLPAEPGDFSNLSAPFLRGFFNLDSTLLYFQTLTLSIPVAPFSSPHGMGGITIHQW